MRKVLFFVLAVVLAVGLNARFSVSAETKTPEVNITSEFDIFEIFGSDPTKPYLTEIPEISCPNGDKYKLSFKFPNRPMKVIFKTQIQMIEANFYAREGNDEKYNITLTGGGVPIPYKCKLLEGKVDAQFFLMLDTKLLEPDHFDAILATWRKSAPLKVEGYIYDKEKDFTIYKHKDRDYFVIKIILHPTSINGVKLFD